MTLSVVFVIGKGRSGSTLLDDLLGTMPGVTSLGELRLLWDRGLQLERYPCACGRHVGACELWGPVLTAAIGGFQPQQLGIVGRLQARAFRWPRVPALLVGARPQLDRRLGEVLGRVYRSVAEATGTRILVDSSKWPMHPGILGLIPGVTPFVLHLVRDPRGVAYSYRRLQRRAEPTGPPHGAPAAALSWVGRNLAAELASRTLPRGRYRRIRYEDLAGSPRRTLRDLGAWLGVMDADRAFTEDGVVELGTAHLIGGNRRRFDRGRVTIAADEEWRNRIDASDRRIITALTWPLLGRYGYGAHVQRGVAAHPAPGGAGRATGT